jgi:hypothetical protein
MQQCLLLLSAAPMLTMRLPISHFPTKTFTTSERFRSRYSVYRAVYMQQQFPNSCYSAVRTSNILCQEDNAKCTCVVFLCRQPAEQETRDPGALSS